MPKPVKPYNPAKIGQEVQINYAFLEKLFGSKQKAFRESFFKCKTLTDLRHKLARQNVIVKGRIRIILVDVENARMKSFGSIHHDYYLLLMPPVPRR